MRRVTRGARKARLEGRNGGSLLRAVLFLSLLTLHPSLFERGDLFGQTPSPDPGLLARAERILRSVPVIDGHNDLPTTVAERGDIALTDIARSQPDLHTDLERLRRGHVGGQFWSAWVDPDVPRPLREALRLIDAVHRLVDRYPELELARTADDITRIQRRGRIASLIGLEGGQAIEGSLAPLRTFHQVGVRYVTLTHSDTHDWADAATDEPRHGGLSPFGEQVVREMNRLGIFVDLSHVSAETMRDALRVTQAPVIFSHSSARAVTDNPRNVGDEVLSLVAENRGVVMVTFVPAFVSARIASWTARRDSVGALAASVDSASRAGAVRDWVASNPAPRATLADVADHIDHIKRTIGVDYIGIGSDYEGISTVPEGLEDVSTFPALFAELLRRGYSDQDIRKIAGQNLLRAMREMERTAERLQREGGAGIGEIGP